MAKRKRLTPAQSGYLSADVAASPVVSQVVSPAPIAQVAGEASARAALEDLADEMAAARAAGRLIEMIPLEQIDEHYLVRDRLVQDEDEMAALMDSLRARGQQTPIEVVRLTTPVGGKVYGLISGWRRLTALKRLCSDGLEPDFATARAQIVTPATAQDAYVAMVEENEIRVNLSHYERARIAVRAMGHGVYDSQRAALQGLYGSTTRSKRSKIGSFVTLVETLDDVLRHPTAISEKLGLDLVREIGRDAGFVDRLKADLQRAAPETAEAEIQVLKAAALSAAARLEGDAPPAPSESNHATEPDTARDAPSREIRQLSPDLRVRFAPGKLELTGDAVDADLAEALEAWLRDR